MLRIWCNKLFSLSDNAWIKSVTSQRLSLGFLPRYAGTSYLRFAATRSIQKCSFFPMLMIFPTEDPEVWRSLDARSVREALFASRRKVQGGLGAFLSEEPFIQGIVM